MEEVDITIIGAGVIGLAVSYVLSNFGKEIVVLEKNPSFGQETSSRNSEVIHAGIYYPKGSLKSETCIRGKSLLYGLCSRYNIPYRKLGKLIIAYDREGIDRLGGIYDNAVGCGIGDLRFLSRKEIKTLEPDIEAESAIFTPDTGIVDTHSLMKFFFQASKERNVDFAFSVEVIGIKKERSFYEITVNEPGGDSFSFQSRAVINCAGLESDKIAEFAGMDPEKLCYRIHYCKGQYFRMRNPDKFRIKHLVYPPPTEIDLGIHLTPDLGGGIRLGPDAKYVKEINYDIEEKEKYAFLSSVSKFLPSLEKDDLIPDTAGVRPKLQSEEDGFRDFVIQDEGKNGFPNFVDLIGIESPGLTSCLAIAETVKKFIESA
ncbi:MAG: hypothetical protein A2Z72_08965 [Omnitrophica bacterium RBG_13_46_9]|nr:MAG: hypothetical protein A2Z72_08965 [Omnitrophica bacterium RBG_13_46_9]